MTLTINNNKNKEQELEDLRATMNVKLKSKTENLKFANDLDICDIDICNIDKKWEVTVTILRHLSLNFQNHSSSHIIYCVGRNPTHLGEDNFFVIAQVFFIIA